MQFKLDCYNKISKPKYILPTLFKLCVKQIIYLFKKDNCYTDYISKYKINIDLHLIFSYFPPCVNRKANTFYKSIDFFV